MGGPTSDFPGLTLVGEPLLGGGHRRGLDPAHSRPANLAGLYDAARFKYLNVLDYGREGHGKWARQFGHRSGTQCEAFHHGAPAGVRQRMEGPIEIDHLVNHSLKYGAASFHSQVDT